MYLGRKDDIRKPLKVIIEANTEFQSKLRALKNSANTNADEAKQYEFLLTDALDTVDSSADDHRKTVSEVEEYMKKKKNQQKKMRAVREPTPLPQGAQRYTDERTAAAR